MPRRLISPVDCLISPINKAGTKYASSAREPVKTIARSTSLTISAQHSQSRRRFHDQGPGGAKKGTSGYLVTRQWILDAQSYEPTAGDLITAIGNRTGLRLYVTGLEDSGHLDGANTLVLIHYSDRRPRG